MGIQEIIKYYGKTWQKMKIARFTYRVELPQRIHRGEGRGRTRAEADG
jgi:hypothetical protein